MPKPATASSSAAESPSPSWDFKISPRRSLFQIDIKEVWRYRDLLLLFVRRDFVAEYKQTILGPIWYFVQPLLTTLIFFVVFNRLAGISTDGVPPILFYLAGITSWNYFAECLKKTSTTFKDNEKIFGKVYFARLVVPISIVVSNLIRFGIQLLLFLGFYLYYRFAGYGIQPTAYLFLFPLLVLLLAGLGLGFGLVVTSLTTKYRDLVFLIQFGIQLGMYVTPVIYPLSAVPEQYRFLSVLNPMTSVIETFKLGFLGQGTFEWAYLGYSVGFTVLVLHFGTAIFNWTEKNFMDNV